MSSPASSSTPPAEVQLDERDGRYLRKAIVWSHAARRRGNPPFGAVVVSAAGEVLAEGCCNTLETGDLTGHAELNVVRTLSTRRLPAEELAGATLYASGEPCVMCAGAICWSGIGRVVYGIDGVRLRAFRGEPRGGALSCRDVLRAAQQPVECIGPGLVDEASAAQVGAWEG